MKSWKNRKYRKIKRPAIHSVTCGKLSYWFLALCKKTTAGLRKIIATTKTLKNYNCLENQETGIRNRNEDQRPPKDCLEKQETGISIEIGTGIGDHRKHKIVWKTGNWDQEKKWRSDRKLRQLKIKIFWKIRKPAIRNRNGVRSRNRYDSFWMSVFVFGKNGTKPLGGRWE